MAWFEPAEGLRTVRGLIQMLEAGIDSALRERLREPWARRLAATGISAKHVDVMT